MSYSLTGNKKNPAQNENGTNSKFHVRIFEADAIESNPNVELKRGGMILFALLCGGDYDNNKVNTLLSSMTCTYLQVGYP